MRVTTYKMSIKSCPYSRTHTHTLVLDNSFRDKTVADVPVSAFLCNHRNNKATSADVDCQMNKLKLFLSFLSLNTLRYNTSYRTIPLHQAG